ncbi:MULTISPECIES: EAL domain-containing protein [unclassified Duganella]|uniref:EAL domain-containing protein n=1 Tax=unclassified Duganella TaxID=2636909 RepID=UPI00088FF7A8|nr:MULTISPECIES: EAL domain-containing protein [unclassified Duganella]SDH55003.1 EAL domain, c-di-GMP-specific phosphodiesterase class I (or its enzymatically inactive variant) [Duganella sp. OV458]SDK68077.1 EAL domain, c-di-GMP-specific phosphodiesterase class I (or its enzymatically inactive variant) [Duganella sp. OV510]
MKFDDQSPRYQPLVDLRNGAVACVEALSAHGDSLALLRRSCEDRQLWQGGVLDCCDLQVALNLGPQQLGDARFGPAVTALLDEYGIAPVALTLELDEATLMHDPAASAAMLDFFKQQGASLTLDQFGAGPACLGNLQRYPFDYIKLDRAVVQGVTDSEAVAALCQALIAMALHLGIRVAADGVQNDAQCAFLRDNLCDLVQGDIYAAPQAPEQLGTLLREDRRLAPQLLRVQQKRRRLLLVDDEANIISALKRLLRPDGYEIHSANSGEQGLEMLAQQPVDVIISDQRMPGLNGADFLRQARILRPDTIRIMLSGYTELQSVTDAVNEGAIYKFLTKPWNDEQLRTHLADAFRLKEIADDNVRLNMEVRNANHELASANRRMEQLLHQMQRQIDRDEISLNIAREILQQLPLPVIGMDDGGMIAFVNGAAGRMFQRSGALLGNEASAVLPQLFPDGGALPPDGHHTDIGGTRYAVKAYPMGGSSASRGSLITFSLDEALP